MKNQSLYVLLAFVALALASPCQAQQADEDRLVEGAALHREVPHEIAEINNGTRWNSINLIVQSDPTDKQVAKLVRWYIGRGFDWVFMYDSLNSYARRNKDDGVWKVGQIAWYDGETLMRLGKTEKQDHEIPFTK
jgi:hypothetical protein